MVYRKISVRNAVAHRYHHQSRHFGVVVCQQWIGLFDIVCRLTQDFDIADHCILQLLILLEGSLIFANGITLNTFNRLQDVVKIIVDP
jgi:hypothetical protein